MFNKKYLKTLIFVGLSIGFLAAAFFVIDEFSYRKNRYFKEDEIAEINIGGNFFQAEIATTPAKRSQGLSGRKDLCESCAMLFVFSERGPHAFWMKKMKFNLDIIWIDKNEIVYMVENASKKKEFEIIKPEHKADKILEINAGLADKLGIKIGDRVGF
jgi:hypothetical protein